jgi:hypothetical protein
MRRVVLVCVFALLLAGSSAGEDVQVIRQEADLIGDEGVPVGTVEYWNTRTSFLTDLNCDEDWYPTDVQVYVGAEPPPTRNGKPIPGQFPCRRDLVQFNYSVMVQCAWEELQCVDTSYVAIHVDLVRFDGGGNIIAQTDAWVYDDEDNTFPFEGLNWGWYFLIECYHP